MMKVTEHNLTEWKLNTDEMSTLITLVKKEMKKHSNDKVTETFYGIMLGKLLIMKHDTL